MDDLSPKVEQFLQAINGQMQHEAGSGNELPPPHRVLHTEQQDLPEMFSLQRSRDRQALYRLDLNQQTLQPELRVLLPTPENMLKFHVYLVTLTPKHPLSATLASLERHQGSPLFHEHREFVLWHLLNAVGEAMKRLFWLWYDTGSQEALPEILVQQVF